MNERISSFDEFNQRRELWYKCLCGDDSNSIVNQMTRMTWNSAVWRFIIECRKIGPRDSNNRIQLNGMISRFVDECFVENQLLHIRRLVDGYSIDDDPNKDVYSLISLLSDLIKHSHLITRENIFLSEGREYDIEKAKEAFFKKTADNSGDFEAHIIQPDEDYMGSKKRHEEFDFLGGVKPQDRKPEAA